MWGKISHQKAEERKQPLCHREEESGYHVGQRYAQNPPSLPPHLAGRCYQGDLVFHSHPKKREGRGELSVSTPMCVSMPMLSLDQGDSATLSWL